MLIDLQNNNLIILESMLYAMDMLATLQVIMQAI